MEKIRLRVQDYVFEYNDKSLKNAMIKVSYGETIDIFNGGISGNTTFELSAKNNEDIEYYLDFTLEMSKEELHHLSTNLIDVSDKIIKPLYFSNSKDKITATLEFLSARDESRYLNPSFCWASKDPENENKVFVKLIIPSKKIFLWFSVLIKD